MNGRVSFLVATLVLSACQDRSTVLDFSVDTLRIAVPPGVSLEALIPSEQMGASGPASDLFFTSTADRFDIGVVDGLHVRLRPKKNNREDLGVLASALRFRGIVSTKQDKDGLLVTFGDKQTAQAFVRSDGGGLANGTYADRTVEIGGKQLILPRGDNPAAQLSQAQSSAHWQLLVGGHVDVAPVLKDQHVSHLRAFKDLRVVSKPKGTSLAIVVNPKRTSAVDSRIFALSGPPAETTKRNPTRAPPAILISAVDDSARARFHRLANQIWRRTGIRPQADVVDAAEFHRRVLSGEFQVLLAPLNPELFLPWLMPDQMLGSLEIPNADARAAIDAKNWPKALSLLSEYVIPLEELREYAAYSAEWCGDVDPKPYSWRWIADLRRCQ